MADASPPPTDARLAPTPVTASEKKDAVPGPTVGLCLGAGAARGYAHIGVIQVLKERGLKKIRLGMEGYPTHKEKVKRRLNKAEGTVFYYNTVPLF